MKVLEEINQIEKRVLHGDSLTKEDANYLISISDSNILDLFSSANRIRNYFKANRVELCSIVNAKSGGCSEDCDFCAQSSKSTANIKVYPLLSKRTVLQLATEAKLSGIKRFSLVISGRKILEKDLSNIAVMISEIRALNLLPCASLGFLTEKELLMLKDAGLERYHHNLETSERFFPQICRTHGYKEKLETIQAAKSANLPVCSGGIFGMGETWDDRIDMAFNLKKLDIDSIPINFLIPIKGTPLGEREYLHPFEALKIASLYRFILPQKEIRICGGRMQILGEFNSLVFFAGADSLMTGNYLTTSGRMPEEDIKLIKKCGLVLNPTNTIY